MSSCLLWVSHWKHPQIEQYTPLLYIFFFLLAATFGCWLAVGFFTLLDDRFLCPNKATYLCQGIMQSAAGGLCLQHTRLQLDKQLCRHLTGRPNVS